MEVKAAGAAPDSPVRQQSSGGSRQPFTKAGGRKPYTITKQRERWTDAEHEKFLEALKLYGRAWRRIEEHIGTKTAVQIRSHAQKFFSKLEKEQAAGVSSQGAGSEDINFPPPRPKRRPSHPYPRKENGGSSSPTAAAKKAAASVLDAAGFAQLKDELGEATVAAVAAAASAAAAAAAAAVVAAAGEQVQAQLQAAPPRGFPFFGLPPSALADLGQRQQASLASMRTLVGLSQPAKQPVQEHRAVAAGASMVRPGAERTGTSDVGPPSDGTRPPGSERSSDGDSACSREGDGQTLGTGTDTRALETSTAVQQASGFLAAQRRAIASGGGSGMGLTPGPWLLGAGLGHNHPHHSSAGHSVQQHHHHQQHYNARGGVLGGGGAPGGGGASGDEAAAALIEALRGGGSGAHAAAAAALASYLGVPNLAPYVGMAGAPHGGAAAGGLEQAAAQPHRRSGEGRAAGRAGRKALTSDSDASGIKNGGGATADKQSGSVSEGAKEHARREEAAANRKQDSSSPSEDGDTGERKDSNEPDTIALDFQGLAQMQQQQGSGSGSGSNPTGDAAGDGSTGGGGGSNAENGNGSSGRGSGQNLSGQHTSGNGGRSGNGSGNGSGGGSNDPAPTETEALAGNTTSKATPQPRSGNAGTRMGLKPVRVAGNDAAGAMGGGGGGGAHGGFKRTRDHTHSAGHGQAVSPRAAGSGSLGHAFAPPPFSAGFMAGASAANMLRNFADSGAGRLAQMGSADEPESSNGRGGTAAGVMSCRPPASVVATAAMLQTYYESAGGAGAFPFYARGPASQAGLAQQQALLQWSATASPYEVHSLFNHLLGGMFPLAAAAPHHIPQLAPLAPPAAHLLSAAAGLVPLPLLPAVSQALELGLVGGGKQEGGLAGIAPMMLGAGGVPGMAPGMAALQQQYPLLDGSWPSPPALVAPSIGPAAAAAAAASLEMQLDARGFQPYRCGSPPGRTLSGVAPPPAGGISHKRPAAEAAAPAPAGELGVRDSGVAPHKRLHTEARSIGSPQR